MPTPRKFSLGVMFDSAMLVFTLAMVWGAVAAVLLALCSLANKLPAS